AINNRIHDMPDLCEFIERSIDEEAPLTIKEGGIIKKGYHELLDELRNAATEGKGWIADLQAREQEAIGLKNLKIKYNRVFGYFFEVSRANSALVPERYIRKQTLANAERYITPELKEIEDKVLGSEEKSKALEYELFQEIRSRVIDETSRIQESARAVSEIDCLASLAECALKNDYNCPVVNDTLDIDIKNGRHPVIDFLMTEERFVANDTLMNGDDRQLILITGPNMAGKSTYIRQLALIALMAQMGSYVPAESATIGLADRIFTRIGASDDLSRGQSTFMVEMLETANILNNCSARSIVVLDEIGRGTSTYDGLSIAWAVAEHIHNELKSRTLFATHYHELTQLAKVFKGISNCNVGVKEEGDTVVFLHKIMEGPADKSYGIHVARLAGLPKSVISRAGEVLKELETGENDTEKKPRLARTKKPADSTNQPNLFDF
ncbi:MAG: DNA mismatch repair protein MutS, partial [Lentisphaeria bacterium]|nr:DNA mismatch repair protein MutS [Lentisphaeria bacterium]